MGQTSNPMDERNMMAHTSSPMEERNMMASSLDHIADTTRFYTDLVNIQLPHYNKASSTPHFTPTSVGVNLMFPYPTHPIS